MFRDQVNKEIDISDQRVLQSLLSVKKTNPQGYQAALPFFIETKIVNIDSDHEVHINCSQWITDTEMSDERRLIFTYCLAYAKDEMRASFSPSGRSSKKAIFFEFKEKSVLFSDDLSFMLFISDYLGNIDDHDSLRNTLMPIITPYIEPIYAEILSDTKKKMLKLSLLGMGTGLLLSPRIGAILTVIGVFGFFGSDSWSRLDIHCKLETYIYKKSEDLFFKKSVTASGDGVTPKDEKHEMRHGK